MKQSENFEFKSLKSALASIDIRLSVTEHFTKNLSDEIQVAVGAAVREVDAALRLLEMIEAQEKAGR